MKVFSVGLGGKKHSKVLFPITHEMVRGAGGHIWSLLEEIECLMSKKPIKGVHYITIVTESSELKVEFDPAITSIKEIKSWLFQEGLLV